MLAVINADHPQRGMLDGFRNVFGADNVSEFDYLERQRQGLHADCVNGLFAESVAAFRPDWLWLQLQDTEVINENAIWRVRRELPQCVVTHWTGDYRAYASPYMASVCRSTHATFCSSVGQMPMFAAAGAPAVRYLQIAVDWEEDYLGVPEWTPPFRVPDVVMCGNWYGGVFPGTAEREAAVQALMSAGIDVGVVGSAWPGWAPVAGQCHVKQQHHVWKRARVCLNVNHVNDVEGYYSDRQLIAMASGRPLVCRRVPGIEREFRDGEHCLLFGTPEECVACARWLLDRPEEADRIGAAGRAEIARAHRWEHRIQSVLPLVEEIARGTP